MSRPILAVDVDGVISPVRIRRAAARPRPASSWSTGSSTASRCAPASGCGGSPSTSSWSGRPAGRTKRTSTCPTCSACRSSHLSFDGAARFGSAHWKLGPLDEYGGGRALAWIDDNFDESCYDWAREREEPTLLVPTESALGLEEAQTEALIAWAAARPAGGAFYTDPDDRVLADLLSLVVLKIPVIGGLWLVWWASQEPEPEEPPRTPTAASSGASRSRQLPARRRAAGPHGGGAARRCRRCPPGGRTRVVRPAAAARFRSRRISRR